MIMWLLILAVVILSFSAFFAAYLAVFYTTSFEIATFAKSTAMILTLAGIILLFIATNWIIGIAGIVGEVVLIGFFRIFWHKRLAKLIARGEDPWAK